LVANPIGSSSSRLDKILRFNYKSHGLSVALAFEEQFGAPLMPSASRNPTPQKPGRNVRRFYGI